MKYFTFLTDYAGILTLGKAKVNCIKENTRMYIHIYSANVLVT